MMSVGLGATGVAAGALVGCGDDDGGTGAAGGIARIPYPEPGSGFDPILTEDSQTHILRNMTNSFLLRSAVGPDFAPGNTQVVADLATDMPEITDGGTTYIFKLRSGVKFHNVAPMNGRELTADDVVYTYDRARVEPSVYADALESIVSVDAVDSLTVRFTLANPYAPALGTFFGLQGQTYQILAPELETVTGGLERAESLIGTGPFMIDTIQPGTQYILKKNPDYFRSGRPLLDEVRLDTGSDPSRVAALFLSGDLDIRTNISLDEVETLQSQISDLVTDKYFGLGGQMIQMRSDRAPLNNADARRGIKMALDIESWATELHGGTGQRDTPVSLVMSDFALDDFGEGEQYHKFDPQKSRQLLDAAGVAEGTELTLEISPDRYGALHLSEAELMAANLRDVGITVNLAPLDSTSFIQKVIIDKNPDDMMMSRRTAWAGDPDDVLHRFFYTDSTVNTGHWSNAELDRLLDLQRTQLDETERNKTIDDIQRILLDECYVTHTVAASRYDVWQAKVSGFRSHVRTDNALLALEDTSVAS